MSAALSAVLGLEDKILLRKLEDNPGLMPVKIGNAKIRDYGYTLIHFYDLNLMIKEINKLHLKSQNITNLISLHKEYFAESVNYLKILNLVQTRVENKIKEIIPHPERIKRGLINILGSVFKAITGNLDATDGDRYERIIKELQTNENKLADSISKQNSISINVINKFNYTIEQVNKHEKLLESKINQISLIIQKTTFRENCLYIKDVLNQIINIYEIIDSTLQDIENSITFCKLKIMHPSIIRTEDLYTELNNLQKRLSSGQMLTKINFENIFLYEKLINIEGFIINNKITYLLHIPITLTENFEIFHLYSVPVLSQSQFKVILPRNKYLVINKLHYTYQDQDCQEALPQLYLCNEKNLKEIQEYSPCTVNLLSSAKNTSACEQIETYISQPIINQLANSNKWLVILPKEEVAELSCFNQIENLKLYGTYILEIPNSCQVTIKDRVIINDNKTIVTAIKPILFPDFKEKPTLMPLLNLSFKLEDLKLDNLQELKYQIISNEPHLTFNQISRIPSFWTILIYVLLIICCIYLLVKKFCPKLCILRKKDNIATSHQPIQLPLSV